MPKLNGFDFLQSLKVKAINGDIKRIVFTINYGVYINRKAELFLHDIEKNEFNSKQTRI